LHSRKSVSRDMTGKARPCRNVKEESIAKELKEATASPCGSQRRAETDIFSAAVPFDSRSYSRDARILVRFQEGSGSSSVVCSPTGTILGPLKSNLNKRGRKKIAEKLGVNSVDNCLVVRLETETNAFLGLLKTVGGAMVTCATYYVWRVIEDD
ncbi:MAG: hypothetical protein AAFP90_00855, partial [Planctomycetota bacterium]